MESSEPKEPGNPGTHFGNPENLDKMKNQSLNQNEEEETCQIRWIHM